MIYFECLCFLSYTPTSAQTYVQKGIAGFLNSAKNTKCTILGACWVISPNECTSEQSAEHSWFPAVWWAFRSRSNLRGAAGEEGGSVERIWVVVHVGRWRKPSWKQTGKKTACNGQTIDLTAGWCKQWQSGTMVNRSWMKFSSAKWVEWNGSDSEWRL